MNNKIVKLKRHISFFYFHETEMWIATDVISCQTGIGNTPNLALDLLIFKLQTKGVI